MCFRIGTVTPSFVADVAAATWRLIETRPAFGLYHCVNSGVTTWLGLAARIRGLMAGSGELVPRAHRGRHFPRAAAAVLRALQRQALGGRYFAARVGRCRGALPAVAWPESLTASVQPLCGDARHHPRNRKARGQAGRVGTRHVYERVLLRVRPNHPVRERFLRRTELGPDAAATQAQVGKLDVGQQLTGRLEEVLDRLTARFVVGFAGLVMRGRPDQDRAINGACQMDAQAVARLVRNGIHEPIDQRTSRGCELRVFATARIDLVAAPRPDRRRPHRRTTRRH